MNTCVKCLLPYSLTNRAEAPSHGCCNICASFVLEEALETVSPFYLHGKALRNANMLNIAPMKVVSECGSSALVGGAFLNAIEFFEQYGVRKAGEA